jgi:hypothetical protein
MRGAPFFGVATADVLQLFGLVMADVLQLS